MNRTLDLIQKAWAYLLEGLAQPGKLPIIVWFVGLKRVHLGEILRLFHHKIWLQKANIKTVIDIGAHKGEFAFAFRAIFPDTQIYSFEPQPDCYYRLATRVKNQENMQAFGAAIGNQDGEISFHQSDFTKASSILAMDEVHETAFPWSASGKEITVPIHRLDSYIDKLHLNKGVLLKIDVQGYELEVLSGAEEFLTYVDYIVVETSLQKLYKGQASFDEIYKFLQERGFEYAGNWDQLLSPIDGTVLQADAVFIRKDISPSTT